MVPAIIASHYGWLKLQENNSLVSPEERKKLAIYSVFFLI
ncbi:hypothetical protein KGM_204022 [Danaus plexippus plexippus]|uniref:Uncharacterized protein n=1 Tax=Danaus plexippus plexippus TaxID=278856 RepID=A0A212FPZ4_DANPL|nr:hypothetical protein KGM_204022 [Danaus plexippus plexippus]